MRKIDNFDLIKDTNNMNVCMQFPDLNKTKNLSHLSKMKNNPLSLYACACVCAQWYLFLFAPTLF